MEDFRKIEELLGWDLNDEAVQQFMRPEGIVRAVVK